MDIFLILFMILPVLAFLGIFLITESLLYGVIAFLVMDLVFIMILFRRRKRSKG